MHKYGFLLLGTLFGFLLSRAGATTQDYYAQLFLFQDLQLLWVILSAVAIGSLGVFLLKILRVRRLGGSAPLEFQAKPMRRGLIGGALLFGIGWGITGACPGTAPAMLGEGKLMALFTIAGIALGTLLYGAVGSRRQTRNSLEGAGRSIQPGR